MNAILGQFLKLLLESFHSSNLQIMAQRRYSFIVLICQQFSPTLQVDWFLMIRFQMVYFLILMWFQLTLAKKVSIFLDLMMRLAGYKCRFLEVAIRVRTQKLHQFKLFLCSQEFLLSVYAAIWLPNTVDLYQFESLKEKNIFKKASCFPMELFSQSLSDLQQLLLRQDFSLS